MCVCVRVCVYVSFFSFFRFLCRKIMRPSSRDEEIRARESRLTIAPAVTHSVQPWGASRSFINHASCFKHRLRAHRATSESCARAAESQVSFISVARLGPTVDFAFAVARSRSRYTVLRGVALPSPSASSSDAIHFGSATFLQWDNRFIICASTSLLCLCCGKPNA